MTKIQWLRGYYLLLGYVTFTFGFKRFSGLGESPVSWLPGFDVQQLGLALVFAIMGLSVACFLNPHSSWLRKILFFIFLIFEIQFNDVGAATHLYEFWLWSSLALALMPKLNTSAKSSEHLTLGIKTCISIILLLYFLSGFWKTYGAFEQILAGEPHLFTSEGLLFHMYSEIIRAGAKPLLLNFLSTHSFLNPILSVSVVVLQLSCVIGIFKTHWHRYLGFGLLLFHAGTALILDITYPTNFLLVTWGLILSPFVPLPEYPAERKGALS